MELFQSIPIFAAVMNGTAVAWRAVANGYHFLRHWPIYSFWRPYISNGLKIYYTPATTDTHPTSHYDWLGIVNLYSLLKGKFGGNVKFIKSTSNHPIDISTESMLLVGGPVANPVTAEVFKQLKDSLIYRFGMNGGDRHVITSTVDSSVRFEMEDGGIDESGAVVRDYGIITCVRNPYNWNSMLLIAAGCYGWGTYAAQEVLQDAKSVRFLRRLLKQNGPEFQVICVVKVRGGHAIECWLLDNCPTCELRRDTFVKLHTKRV